ncbi:CDR ABC transporter [Penicillium digitatum]|uniref:ABC-2 type transporter domain-containing protein n=3 Tax=Penicillium digitatum TaxID=36651 RepID=K9FQY1_PEND2|nr:hypothetical protein PDIP_42320 [Penicillium digitatum Pd1]EKV11589.1 hypothetical protein PDIG_49450 [Penicillium digitatum PHI26]EKV14839.1 hypothetical protein PDIP_42320 [Penicillium digitatum Pd1]QQK46389.1 CDR ABC transporter [Penicillium digitatum]
MIAATLMPFFIIMCELFNGILRPQSQMPAFWKYTMYYVTPFTYWIGEVLTSVLRGTPVVYSQSELAIFESPPNTTCSEYANAWLDAKAVGLGDDYLAGIGLDSSKIWPYLGIFLAFTVANYLLVYMRFVMTLFWQSM